MNIKLKEIVPSNGVASEGEAWNMSRMTDTELVYRRDCDYDGDWIENRKEKQITISKEDGVMKMTVRVVIGENQYTYNRLFYEESSDKLVKKTDSDKSQTYQSPSLEKVKSIFRDTLYDETRHGANNYQYYC